MQGQQSGSTRELRRQLIFLKSIDQKLEGLRRENERLRRIVSNPRVRFSRSSLGGLYRIVNGMTSAGPMYHLDTIGKWAEKTRDWLVELGKRGDGPSDGELDWLTETISELSEIREVALASVEAALKERWRHADSDSDSDDDEAKSPPEAPADSPSPGELDKLEENPFVEPEAPPTEEASANESELGVNVATEKWQSPKSEENAIFPFTDEPAERSIADADFWQQKEKEVRRPERRRKDRTSTIPLALDDLKSISPPATKPITPPPVPSGRNAGFWKPLAITSVAGFLVMTFLFIWVRIELGVAKRTASDMATLRASAPLATTPKSDPSPPLKEASKNVRPNPASVANNIEKGSASINEADIPASQKQEKTKKPVPESKKKPKIDTKPDKPSAQINKKALTRKNKKKEESIADKNVGTLNIRAPSDGGSVLVLVDGISRGKAPVRVKLSPGLHEVVFTKDGKKSIRMVPIRPEVTKTISAEVP
jgi:hypothetical protein